MSEVQSRPVQGRGRGNSARGGRGGFSSRGGRGGRGHATNGDHAAQVEDEGEVGQLKRQYGSKVTTIKEMFPDWTDEDVVMALQENDGDLETTVGRITDGTITQWGEVSKVKKDRSRSKAKDSTSVAFGDSSNQSRPSRGGRAGFDSGRGGRGRGTDRGRGGKGRGASVAHHNGSHKENVESTPAVESADGWDTNDASAPAWETTKSEDTAPAATENSTLASSGNAWDTSAPKEPAVTPAAAPAPSLYKPGQKKTWASMLAPVPILKKLIPSSAVEKAAEPELAKEEDLVETPAKESENPQPESAPYEPIAEEAPTPAAVVEEPELPITPSQDELTEDNLEQVPDISAPAPTATAASTAASSWDPRSTAAPSTPYSSLQQGQAQAIRPPPTSGFQTSALKATGSSGRTPSYQRRVLDQEEAVRMPGNREVDRAAVQFGAFNLNGSGDEDVDGDREEPETRGQPPQHSPVAPRASLPPAPVAQLPAAVSESFPTPKQPAAGLPAAAPTAAPGLPSPQSLPSAQSTSQAAPQANAQYSQYGRFAQGTAPEQSAVPAKAYDAFSQQAASTQSPFEGYSGQQPPSQPQQSQSGPFSSAPNNEFSQYYTADSQQRNAYNGFYNQQQYGLQQAGQGQQEGPGSQQRSYSGYGGPQSEATSQFSQSAAQSAQSRYATAGEGQNSGHTTPNPTTQQQPGANQAAQPQPGHPQQPQGGSYPYGHPYYSSPYYAAYMNQYQNYAGGNYPGAPYGAKGGLHQQPYQGYGMSPGAPYEQHASSPAAGGFGAASLHGREGAIGGGLGEYGRGSAQSSQTPQGLGGSGAFSGAHDAFGRGSSYQGQNQQHYSANQSSQQGAENELKPFSDKTTNGPSPSLSQAGRPGSATNTAPGSALPPPQSQGGYGGYPGHLQQGLHGSQAGSQYAGLAGAGGHQAGGQGHQNSQYGGYQAFGSNYYGNSQQRGGWGGNYGH